MLIFLLCLAAVLEWRVLGAPEPSCRCVKPTDQEVRNPCPSGECHLLMDYTRFPANFSDCTVFKFLPGNHSLDVSIFIKFVHNLSLSGVLVNESRSVVQCSGISAGIWFEDVTDLQIDGLGFKNCGFYERERYFHAIVMHYVTNLRLSNVHINDSEGYGLYVVNLEGKSFINNTVITGSRNRSGCFAGNLKMIYNVNTSQESHSILIASSSFTNGYIPYKRCTRHEAYATGLGIFLVTTNSIEIILRDVTLSGSQGRNGGNLAISYVHLDTMANWTSSVTLDNCTLTKGTALLGGGMYLSMVARQTQTNNTSQQQFVDVITIHDTVISYNSASVVGGGLYAQLYEEPSLSTGAHIKISNTKFHFNSVDKYFSKSGGVALNILNFQLAGYMPHRMPEYNVSLISCHFYGNQVNGLSVNNSVGGGIVYIEQNSLTHFRDVEIDSNDCTGVVLIRSNVVLEGINIISRNVGNYGGGIVLCDNSVLYLKGSTSLNISHNTALTFGGGIYTEFDCAQAIPPCFFQFDSTDNKTVYLEQNTAAKSGSALFGGSIGFCYFFGYYNHENSTEIFFEIFRFPDHSPNDTSYIASNPERACFCSVSDSGELTKNCGEVTRRIEVYPGSIFEVPLVIVGQRNGGVPGIVIASNGSNEPVTRSISGNKCINLSYTFVMVCGNGSVEMSFTVQDRLFSEEHTSSVKNIALSVVPKPCPLGFQLQRVVGLGRKCVCNDLLLLNKVECQISSETIYKHTYSKGWFGFVLLENTSKLEIVSSLFCPFDYCNKSVIHSIKVTEPLTADNQCAFSRSGILCGGCNGNLSVILGSSECWDCSGIDSKRGVVALVALFGVAGIVLVIFLGVTGITVTEGTLNPVIFYMNVVAVNRSILFSSSTENTFIGCLVNGLRVFTAWMNLDFGIKVCFYDGMTPLKKVMLQFVFPLYLWCISGAVIIICRKSLLVSKYLGRNSVKVLATVILLSYAKLLRAVIDSLLYTPLHHSSGHHTNMWSIDGNIIYFEKNHVILFVIANVSALVTLPYTLALLFIQCLRRQSNMKVLFWVNKLKPFFDAYTGPYKDKYHFWTGFLLMVRILLFIAIAFDIPANEVKNITYIIGTTSILFVITRPGLYKSWGLNLIEVLTNGNLTLLAVLTVYNARFRKDNNYNVTVCIGSMVLFVFGVIVYHILKKVSVTRRWGLMKVWLLDRRWPWMKRKPIRSLILPYVDPDNDEYLSSSEGELDPILHNAPPVARYDEYREPLIETTTHT